MGWQLECKNPLVNGLLYKVRAEQLGTAFDNELEAIDKRIETLEAYKSAFFRVGADIAKGECCDHLLDECDNPNRCLREHLLVKFLAERRKLKTREDE